MNDNQGLEFSCALVQHAEDNKPVLYDFKWKAIVNLLSRSSEQLEKDGEAFIPAKFGLRTYTSQKTGEEYEGIYRRASAVEFVSMAVADFDDGTTIERATELWKDYEFVLYTSHSHTQQHHKFRVVLPLAEPIQVEHWRSAWLHFYEMASGENYRIDRACKDPARLYYLPSHPPSGSPVYIHNVGTLLSLPVTEHSTERIRKENTKQSWKEPHRLRQRGKDITLQDWLNAQGVVYDVGSHYSHGTVYKLHTCPWGSSHTNKKDGIGHAAVFVNDGKWCFSCCHDHCSNMGWSDFRQHVSPKRAGSRQFQLGFGKGK